MRIEETLIFLGSVPTRLLLILLILSRLLLPLTCSNFVCMSIKVPCLTSYDPHYTVWSSGHICACHLFVFFVQGLFLLWWLLFSCQNWVVFPFHWILGFKDVFFSVTTNILLVFVFVLFFAWDNWSENLCKLFQMKDVIQKQL